MTTKSRTRFQHVALFALGALLIAFGIQKLGGITFETPEPPLPTEAVSLDDVLLDETLAVGSGATVLLELSSEDVVIEEGRGGAVRVLIEGETEAARAFFRDQNYSAREQKSGAVLQSSPDRRSERRRVYRDGDTPRVRVQVPAGMYVSYDGTSGDLRIDKLSAGALSVDTGSGDVALGEITAGELTINTGSGDVDVESLQTQTGRFDTGSGDVSIERSSGALEVDTGSGDIQLGGHDGPLVADTGSGDVAAQILTAVPVTIDTGSGDIALALRDAELDVETNGDVTIGGTLDFDGRAAGGTARGRIGAGGPDVEVRSGSGEVALRAL